MRVLAVLGMALLVACTHGCLPFIGTRGDRLWGKGRGSAVTRVVEETRRAVDEAVSRTLERDLGERESLSPSQSLSFPKLPEPASRSVSRAAEIMEASVQAVKKRVYGKARRSPTDVLPEDVLTTIANLSGCLPRMLPPRCPRSCLADKYRLITGACNNSSDPFAV
uniref:Thyroid peroxidase n=1 Tax=Suricata suricatta TaxID=37032 RepID=A0A673VBY1_SURSU